MSYPVTYSSDHVEQRSRLTTFFRLLTVIPPFIFAALVGLAGFFAIVAAWFALLFTGRYPQGLYDFVSGVVRVNARTYAYYFLASDKFPPFSMGEEPDYEVRVTIAPPQESYSRVKVFFRGLLLIPVVIVLYVLQIVASVVSIVCWFAIVFTGKQPAGLQGALNLYMPLYVQTMAYIGLLTDAYPPIGEVGADPVQGDGKVIAAA